MSTRNESQQLNLDREQAIAFVEGSPAAVAAQDREAWLSLFAVGAAVEDPVGSAPNSHDGDCDNGPLARFYKTFINGNRIIFHRGHDYVCGNAVMRDLEIEVHLSSKVVNRVPMHLLYELGEVDGELKIQRLAAHWELGPMLKNQMSFGLASIPAGTRAFGKMLRYLGLGGVIAFMRAANTVGEAGSAALAAWAEEQGASLSKQLLGSHYASASFSKADGSHGVVMLHFDDKAQLQRSEVYC